MGLARSLLAAAVLLLLTSGSASADDARCSGVPGGSCVRYAELKLADGLIVSFTDYPPEYIRQWQFEYTGATVDQFVVAFRAAANADPRFPTREEPAEFLQWNRLLSRRFSEDLYSAYLKTTFTCLNSGVVELVQPIGLRTRATSSPMPANVPYPPSTARRPGELASAPTATPADLQAMPGWILMRPDPITRLRPDRTEFELTELVVFSSGPDASLPRFGVDPDQTGENLVGPVNVTHTYSPQEPSTTWDLGDAEGADSGSYRTTYLYPRTSRDGPATLDDLPAFQVTARVRWRVDVRIDWSYRESHTVISDWNCPPQISGQTPPPCTPVWDTVEHTHSASRWVRGAAELTASYSRPVVVVQTDVIDGPR